MSRLTCSRFTQLVMTGLLGGMLCLSAGMKEAQAWDGGTNVNTSFALSGCTVQLRAQNPTAYLSIFSAGNTYYVDGKQANVASITTGGLEISTSVLNSCGVSSVNLFSPIFVGSDFSTMTEISISFTGILGDGVVANAQGGAVTGDTSATVYLFTYSLKGIDTAVPELTFTVVEYTAPSTTATKVETFIAARADRIVGGQPDYLARLTGNGSNNENNPLGINGNGNVGSGFAYVNASFNTNLGGFGYMGSNDTDNTHNLDGRVGPYSSWTSGSYSYAKNGNSKSHIGLFQTGVDYRLSEDKLVGFVAQFDFTDENNATDSTSANGWGWLAGPYVAARIQENLYFDAVANYGQSYNNMQAVAGVNGDFTTERFLISAKLSGDFKLERNVTINPFAKVTYFHEKQNGYTDSASNVIASQTFTLGQLEFGPKISTTIDLDSYRFDPFISFSGIWDFDSINTSTSTANIRGAIKSGFVIAGDDNISLNFEGFYDGIGVSNFQAYGGTLGVRVSF